jgi:Flp pilus assembly protein TadG
MPATACTSDSLCLGFWTLNRIRFARTFIQRSDETGGALVELALCLPILLALVTGIASFGIAFNNYLMLTNAVDTGARQLSIIAGLTTDPCQDVSKTIAAAAPLLNSANIKYTFTLNNGLYVNKTTSCTAGAAQVVAGAPMQVTVTYPCSLLIYGKNVIPGCTLTAQATELEQ